MANNIQDDTNNSSLQKPGTIIPAPQNLAINLIREKLDSLYMDEPDALKEEAEVAVETHRSKHQQFMYDLMTSGKDLAQIQTEWHLYYQGLNADDKRQVWQEFYDSNKNAVKHAQEEQVKKDEEEAEAKAEAERKKQEEARKRKHAQQLTKHVNERATRPKREQRKIPEAATLRKNVRSKATTPPKLTWKHHLQSALFGLGMGALVVFILLFGFFNEVIIAPFIQPSRHDTATPIILSNTTISPSATPEVIIPKINVEIPVDYSVNTTDESVIENFLNDGVVHYPTTSVPGQTGNAAFFGHSSNNIFNPGKYKFAFVLLHDLVPGDVFYLTYNGKVYAYKVFSTTIVNPSDVGVLSPVPGHTATATLITCDPPGTSINRLVVVGDQISPDPSGDSAPTTPVLTSSTKTSQLPGNGPSLWHRFFTPIWGKMITVAFLAGSGWLIWRWYDKEFRKQS